MGDEATSLLLRAATALFYGVTSILTVFVNKILLTNYGFPSFLAVGIGQAIVVVLLVDGAAAFGLVDYPPIDKSVAKKIFPLPIFYALNLMSSLGGIQRMNLPMYTVLRRFAILFTMLLEYFILSIRPSRWVQLTVALMISGSFVAGLSDLSFDIYGYAFIFLNDICSASNAVLVKQKLEAKVYNGFCASKFKDFGKHALLYYNCLFALIPTTILAVLYDDHLKVREFVQKTQAGLDLWAFFALACICGCVLIYAQILCTHYNSALTTACVGPIKNVIVTYVGMIASGDYVFQWTNFIGINISTLGGIIYVYVTFVQKHRVNLKDAERENLV